VLEAQIAGLREVSDLLVASSTMLARIATDGAHKSSQRSDYSPAKTTDLVATNSWRRR